MRTRVERRTVNLSAYPDLVVIYLGMRVNRIAGIKTLLGFGPKISSSAAAPPDGLLRHETIIYSLFPMHIGMRQYWRDANSLLRWTRSDPHRQWWQSFLKDSGGTGFWHETYFRRGGIEAVYGDVPENIGLMAFAPVVPLAPTEQQALADDISSLLARARTPGNAPAAIKDRTQWRKLQRHMTKDEVKQLLGDPDTVSVSRFYEAWNYAAGSVTFNSKGHLEMWTED
jgi:hypothetical protein